MADINIIDIVKEKVGVDTSAEGLIEAAQEKIEDGTLDETLEKIGVKNSSKISGFLKGVLGIFGILRNMFGKKQDEEEEVEDEEEEEDEE